MSRQKIIIISAISAIVFTLGFLYYHFFVFHVTRISPSAREFPSFARYVNVYFSHPIKSVKTIELNGERVYGEVLITGNLVRYTHVNDFATDTESTLKFKEVTAQNGSVLRDVTFTFTPRYIDFNDLPEDVRQASIEKASSGQKDDPFFNTYFPIIEDEFEIELIENPVTMEGRLYVTFLTEVYDYDTEQQTRLPNAEAEALRDKVLAHIRSLGGTPEKYEIHYDNPYLEVKYNPSQESHPEERDTHSVN